MLLGCDLHLVDVRPIGHVVGVELPKEQPKVRRRARHVRRPVRRL